MKSAGNHSFVQMMSNLTLLAFDYDGTIATEGAVSDKTLKALETIVATGRTIVLATGRQLPELMQIFHHLSLFAYVVAENGAVVYEPSTGEVNVLGERPPEEFIRSLEKQGIKPVACGEAVVATSSRYADALKALITKMDLSHQVILNKDSAMVLSRGVNKGSGLLQVLDRLGVQGRAVIGVGDGENDVDLFEVSAFRVAVANAVPELKEMANWVTPAEAGKGVEQLSNLLMASPILS